MQVKFTVSTTFLAEEPPKLRCPHSGPNPRGFITSYPVDAPPRLRCHNGIPNCRTSEKEGSRGCRRFTRNVCHSMPHCETFYVLTDIQFDAKKRFKIVNGTLIESKSLIKI